MRLFSLVTACALSAAAHASPRLAPPAFDVAGGRGRAVFVDFQDATYDITYDIPHKETRVRATINFFATDAGLPAFDFSGEATSVTLDGAGTSLSAEQPDADGAVIKVAQTAVEAGAHTLVIEHKMTGEFAPTYTGTTVQSGFFTDDFTGQYMQAYLPSNFEFDQFKIVFNVEILGLSGEQMVFANGDVTAVDASHWRVEYPDYFNESAAYFHTLPKAAVKVVTFTVDNGGGVAIPAVAYKKTGDGSSLTAIKATAIKAIADLTKRFGNFAHPSLTVYAQEDGGGMEYDGATVSSDWALAHELAHSYFGRAVMPANGNAGWIDEGMATLTEGPYAPDASDISPTNMSGHSPYFTGNDNYGYTQGMNLLAHFGDKFHAADASLSIDGFLRGWYATHRYTTVAIDALKADMESYSGLDLSGDFATYVFGQSAPRVAAKPPRSPLHRALTPAEFHRLQ